MQQALAKGGRRMGKEEKKRRDNERGLFWTNLLTYKYILYSVGVLVTNNSSLALVA
jgi:hypothetical protein